MPAARPTATTSSPSSTRWPTPPPPRDAMKFGIFYEHQLPRPWDGGQRAQAHPGRARPGRAGRPARLRRRVGGRAPLPRGVLALQRARGVPRRGQPAHQGHPPRPRHHPDRAAATTTRPAPPSASRCSTSCRAAASSSARASRPRRPSSAGFGIDPFDKRDGVARGPRGRAPVHDRDALHRRRRPVRLDAAAQRRAQAGAEAAPAAVGGVLAARHDPARRREGHRRAHASPSSTPRRPSTGSRDYETTHGRAVRARRRGRQRQRRLRHPDDVRPDRGGRHRARASRAATSSATRSATTTSSATTCRAPPTCGRSSSSSGAEQGYSPDVEAALERGAPRRQGRQRRHHRACGAPPARPTRSASTCAATRRPASTSSSS